MKEIEVAARIGKEPSREEINEAILKKLIPDGRVSSDFDVIHKLDTQLESGSLVIPVKLKKDQTLGAHSKTCTPEELEIIREYVERKIGSIGEEIFDGRIDINPFTDKGKESCTYCDYKSVCGVNSKLPGINKRKMKLPEDTNVIEVMERGRD